MPPPESESKGGSGSSSQGNMDSFDFDFGFHPRDTTGDIHGDGYDGSAFTDDVSPNLGHAHAHAVTKPRMPLHLLDVRWDEVR